VDELKSGTPGAATLGDGRYVVRRELGRGTMGVVYEAEDTVLARTVAVKTVELAFAADEEARHEFEQRFFTEARVAARLSHPGIVVCHDFGKERASGKLFIVFEYLKGRTLPDRAAEGPMPWRDALGIVVQVARAIHHAHEHGVIHRDLKPANIMLLERTSGGSAARGEAAVKIMDFGVARLESLGARLTRTGQSFGSPLYMSPEQALGQASSAHSDIFSLGSVLCTLLLGRPWFDAPSIPEIVARVVHDDPPRVSSLRPGVPAALDGVVAKALAKRGEDRYATAADMADDLEDVLAGATPRHARADASSGPPGGPSSEDALLAGLTAPAGGPGRVPAPDPSVALASLVDEEEASTSGAAGAQDAATMPVEPAAATTPTGTAIPARPTAPAGAPKSAPTASVRRWRAPAGAVIVLALLAAGAFLFRRPSPGLEPARSPSPPLPSDETPVTALPTPTTITSAPVPLTVASPIAPSVPRAAAKRAPAPPAPTASPAANGGTDEVAADASPNPARARLRLNVEHPFENGRLVVWIDGVLVFETKLQAPVSKKIVAIKIREGHVEKLLDVEPGPHEVRVEVTWDQGRRVSTKVADVAPDSTGLLEVRVGRLSKDLSLEWSRLAKD
jgi:serine/threonine protein kinase